MLHNYIHSCAIHEVSCKLCLRCWTFFGLCCSLLHNAPVENGFEPCQKKPRRHIFLAACPTPLPLLPRPETVPRCFFSAYQTHPDKERARLELRLLSARFGWCGLGRKIKGFSVLSASVSECREQFVTLTASKPSALSMLKDKPKLEVD